MRATLRTASASATRCCWRMSEKSLTLHLSLFSSNKSLNRVHAGILVWRGPRGFLFIDSVFLVCGRFYWTVPDLSVRLSICPSVCPIYRPLQQHVVGLRLWAQLEGDINWLLHGRRSAATARSITLSAGIISWTQTCLMRSLIHC